MSKTFNIGDLVINLILETRMKNNEYLLCHKMSNGNIHYHGYLSGGYVDGTRIMDIEKEQSHDKPA